MVDFEDPKTIGEIASPIREGVETRTQNHVLLHPVNHRSLEDVLGYSSTNTYPAGKAQQGRAWQFRPYLIADLAALVSSEAQRDRIIEHPRRWLLSMKSSSRRSEHRRSTRARRCTRHGWRAYDGDGECARTAMRTELRIRDAQLRRRGCHRMRGRIEVWTLTKVPLRARASDCPRRTDDSESRRTSVNRAAEARGPPKLAPLWLPYWLPWSDPSPDARNPQACDLGISSGP